MGTCRKWGDCIEIYGGHDRRKEIKYLNQGFVPEVFQVRPGDRNTCKGSNFAGSEKRRGRIGKEEM